MVDDHSTGPWFTVGGRRPADRHDRPHVHLAPDIHASTFGNGSNGQAHWRSGPQYPSPPNAHGAGSDGSVAASRNVLRGLRVLIIDDCTLYRENLAATFRNGGAADVGVAWNLSSLVIVLGEKRPNILLLNVATRDSALLLRAAADIDPDVNIIVLGVSDDDESQIVACAEAGAVGYHMRTESLDDLLILIGRVAAGENSFSPSLASMLLRRLAALSSERQPTTRELALTGREAQILQMLELGLTNQDIAMRLSIAVHTVKNHVHSLLKKLGVNTRAEAAELSRAIRLTHE